MATILPLEGSASELRNRLAGAVHTPDDPSFDRLRLAWNRAYQHHPALVVVPQSAADVATTVRFASDRRIPVVVQATGHGVARPADGALLLLTHRLGSVTVDGDAWTARIGSGASWGKVISAAAPAGLAPVVGSTPSVGAVGSTLGGGMGWLARKYGLAADHVRSIEIVTADGLIRRASPDGDTDLFWALRGGGAGSFGVVTAMEIDLVPVSSLYAGNLYYPAAMARSVSEHYREWIETAPDELTSALTFVNIPPDGAAPAELRGRSLVSVGGAVVGSDDDGEALLRHWRSWQTPTVDRWGRTPITEVASIGNEAAEPLARLTTSVLLDSLTDDVVALLAGATFDGNGPSRLTAAEVRHAAGAVARAPEYPSAYCHRERRHVLRLVGHLPSLDQQPALAGFMRQLHAALAPHTASGAYLNFLEGDERVRRSAEAFTPAVWQRLREVKTAHDPANVFGHGVGITP